MKISYEEACAKLKEPTTRPDVSGISEDERASTLAYHDLKMITRAMNMLPDGTEWKADYKNWDDPKYQPIFYIKDGGSAFSYYGCGNSGTGTHAGSRLSYRTRELAKQSAEDHIDLWNDFLS